MQRFALLEPRELPPRELGPTLTLAEFLAEPPKDRELVIDFESRGLDTWAEGFLPVGAGLAGASYGPVYINLHSVSDADLAKLVAVLHGHSLVAHNVLFDAAVLRWCERRASVPSAWPWLGCTFALYQQLASEGWEGQSWGLKSAMRDLLGWPHTNEEELDQWLVTHGHFTVNHAKQQVPLKSEMWRAPAEILGRYCKLDCEATWLIWNKVLRPAARKHAVSLDYLTHHTMTLFKRLLDQQDRGTQIDVPALQAHYESTKAERDRRYAAWRQLPEVAPLIEEHKQLRVEEHRAKPAGQKQFTKDGQTNKNWAKWADQLVALEATPYMFSYTSDLDLRWLLYERLGYPVLLRTNPSTKFPQGQAATSDKALAAMGAVGKGLIGVIDLETELRYVEACLANVDKDGLLRPKFSYSTITGRLKGGIGKE